MSRLLIIGCGGVAQVAIRKCCQNSEVFTDIMIASRTLSKCDDLKAKLEGKTASRIETARVDADNVEELKTLIRFVPAGCSAQCGTPLSGSYDYGCMSCLWS